MYDLPYFKEDDKKTLLQFVDHHPFGFLSGSDARGNPVATQIPMLLEERADKIILHGHIMRKTDHHNAFLENPQVLTVFSGPHTYVSGTWYKEVHIASTWNYMSVQMHGRINFLGEDALISLLKKLTLKFENNNTASSTVYDNLPDDFIKHMLPAIVAFEIEVNKTENVFKLSQNRDKESYHNIIQHLEKKGGDAALIAEEMKKRAAKLFPPGVSWDSKKFLS
jgi:transcriptional regulator